MIDPLLGRAQSHKPRFLLLLSESNRPAPGTKLEACTQRCHLIMRLALPRETKRGPAEYTVAGSAWTYCRCAQHHACHYYYTSSHYTSAISVFGLLRNPTCDENASSLTLNIIPDPPIAFVMVDVWSQRRIVHSVLSTTARRTDDNNEARPVSNTSCAALE